MSSSRSETALELLGHIQTLQLRYMRFSAVRLRIQPQSVTDLFTHLLNYYIESFCNIEMS